MNKLDIKYLLRSKSFQFMNDRTRASNELHSYSYMGNPLYYRPATTDVTTIYGLLLKEAYKAEYWIPSGVNPKSILDFGGNIGAAAVYYTNMFPEAKIYSFEPMPENFEILKKNVEPYKNVTPFNCGAGKESGTRELFSPEGGKDFAGTSLYTDGERGSGGITVTIRTPEDIFSEIGESKFDLIKIDTEGAEYDILTSIPEETIKNVKWIIGELHGLPGMQKKDFEVLTNLSDYFEIDVRKTLHKPGFNFNACNKNIINDISTAEIRHLQY